jgi:hypothetical protein
LASKGRSRRRNDITAPHFVHFFASEAAALKWPADHGNTFVLSIEEGFEIRRMTNKAKFGAALAATDDHPGAA